MKKINRTVVVLLILCGIWSCGNNKIQPNYLQNVTQIQGRFLSIDSLIGNPYDIVCRDSLLIYYDRYERKFLSVFNFPQNKFIGRFISEGNGPGEAIAPLYILSFPEKDKIYVYQRNSATVSMLDVPGFRIERNIPFSASGMYVKKNCI